MFCHVYCPNFFIQCERLFRPELLIKPERGIQSSRCVNANHSVKALLVFSEGNIIACSDEAKIAGFHTGLSKQEVSEQLEKNLKQGSESSFIDTVDIIECPANWALYADLSERLHKSLELLAPNVEAISNNEAVLDLHKLSNKHDLHNYAQEIQNKIQQWLGLDIMVGIGKTQSLANLACGASKSTNAIGNTLVLDNASASEKTLINVAVKNLAGISAKSNSKLSELGIDNALELSRASKPQLAKHCSPIVEHIAIELSGLESELSVNQAQGVKTRLFEGVEGLESSNNHAKNQLKRLKQVLIKQVEHVCSTLNAKGLSCGQVYLGLNRPSLNNDLSSFTNQLSIAFSSPCDSPSAVKTLSLQMLESLFRSNCQYESISLKLENLSEARSEQISLFNQPSEARLNNARLTDNAATSIEHTEDFTILSKTDQEFQFTKGHLRPQSFTTQWADIMRVS